MKKQYNTIAKLSDGVIESFINGDIPNTNITFQAECRIERDRRIALAIYTPGTVFTGPIKNDQPI